LRKNMSNNQVEENKKLIILVDDNPTNLLIGKNALKDNYVVATAPSAKKLFSLLENNYPAMILLDIDMPEMNGYEAIKILKAEEKTRKIPVIFLTAKTDTVDEFMGLSLGAIDYIIKPFQRELLLKRIEVHLLVEDQRETLQKQANELEDFNANLKKKVDEKTQEVVDLQDALLKTMAEMVEFRDDTTGGHIERTQQWVKILLEEIERSGIYREEVKNLNVSLLLQSCQLHDVGKISISDNILKKPGKLTVNEFTEMKKHTVFGEQIIEKIESMAKENEFLKYAHIFASGHHERWDGTGYPLGLKGREIPLLGRIMAIADVYDALISKRPYKEPFSHETSVQIINEGSGAQFDPSLVEVFNLAADRFKERLMASKSEEADSNEFA